MNLWSAPAERSGDGALAGAERRGGHTAKPHRSHHAPPAHAKAASRFACRRTPKWPALSLLLLLFVCQVSAHELRPAYLELHEDAAGEFAVLWKTPMRGEMRLSLAPVFSGKSEAVSPVITRDTGAAAVQTWRLRAPELRGQTLRIAGLEGTMTDALVRIEFADGTGWTQRLTAAAPAATVPRSTSAWEVAGVYSRLGVEHILTGVDHLLFVLALLIITSGTLRLVKTVTAFTIAHSITLALATLGFVHVPSKPVEAAIALSIVFVAAEIVHLRPVAQTSKSAVSRVSKPAGSADLEVGDTAGLETCATKASLTARAPWIVAFTFGLLHGFGFAGALSEVGLPQAHIPAALLCFNLGVEAGQLLFIAAVLSLIALARRTKVILPRWTELFPPYAIGSVAMFWVIQRVAAF